MAEVTHDELTARCREALLAVGATAEEAQALAAATADAEFAGKQAVGVAHLSDYLDGYRAGRITAGAVVTVEQPRPGVVSVDAGGGLAQVAYEWGFDEFRDAIDGCGVAALWIRGSFTCGELGHYCRRLANTGRLAVAMANSPALMSLGGSPRPVVGTNPLAFGVPRPGVLPMVIDQASSATAFVNVRRAAAAGEPLPPGWALGPDGEPTTDAAAALDGALLPFGGHRGGNVALLIEILATLSGANSSLTAPPFERGTESPGIGVFVLGIAPDLFAGSADRLVGLFTSLTGHDVTLPSLSRTQWPACVDIDAGLLVRMACPR